MFLRVRNLAFLAAAGYAAAQAPTRLTLQQAEALAIQNHPQIAAAQNEVNFANQQIVINRAAYFPGITGEITGSQGNDLSRIGAGDLSAAGGLAGCPSTTAEVGVISQAP